MANRAKHSNDLAELLETLTDTLTELGAIREAAKDFVTLKETVKPMPNMKVNHVDLAYNHLKELVY